MVIDCLESLLNNGHYNLNNCEEEIRHYMARVNEDHVWNAEVSASLPLDAQIPFFGTFDMLNEELFELQRKIVVNEYKRLQEELIVDSQDIRLALENVKDEERRILEANASNRSKYARISEKIEDLRDQDASLRKKTHGNQDVISTNATMEKENIELRLRLVDKQLRGLFEQANIESAELDRISMGTLAKVRCLFSEEVGPGVVSLFSLTILS